VKSGHTTGRLGGKLAIVTGAAPRAAGVGNGSAFVTLFSSTAGAHAPRRRLDLQRLIDRRA